MGTLTFFLRYIGSYLQKEKQKLQNNQI